jgi:hypothetical protein
MDINEIREAVHRQPFEPFSIRLVDGRDLPVRHPDFVAVGERRFIVLGREDSWAVVDPAMVVSLDYSGTRFASTA